MVGVSGISIMLMIMSLLLYAAAVVVVILFVVAVFRIKNSIISIEKKLNDIYQLMWEEREEGN